MKHIVMTSGGVGSFITLEMVVRKYGAENVVSLFADTKMEDEDLYRFLQDTHNYLGVPLTTIADGRNPWEVFRDRKFIGNSRVDLCSRILKRELMDGWIEQHFKPDECICYIGVDWSEKHRYDRLAPRKLPYVYKAPMVDEMIMVSQQDKETFCTARGIRPPRLYGMGFAHNNCGGFCVKSGLGQFKMLYEQMPERYLWHEAQERSVMAGYDNLKPFLRKRIDGVTHYMTMQEYREAYLMPDSPGQLTIDDEIDLGGCGCAIDYNDEEPEPPVEEEKVQKLSRVFFQSGDQVGSYEWATPQALFDKYNSRIHFDVDLAASPLNAKCEAWLGPSEFILPEYLRLCELERSKDKEVRAEYRGSAQALLETWGRCSLQVDWSLYWKRGWCNPPYGRAISGYLEHAHQQIKYGMKSVTFLLPVRTDTQWFHKWVLPTLQKDVYGTGRRVAGIIDYIEGRVQYEMGGEPQDPAPFPSMIVHLYAVGEDK